MEAKIKLSSIDRKEIHPAAYNPRNMDLSRANGLKASMNRFGYVEPIVWNRRTGNIIGGHQRFENLRDAEKIDVVEVDISENEEKALNVTLNNQEIQGSWDLQKLDSLLDEIRVEFTDFSLVGLDMLENSLFGKDEIEEKEKSPSSKKSALKENWCVVVDCESEKKQIELLERLEGEGLKCRLWMF